LEFREDEKEMNGRSMMALERLYTKAKNVGDHGRDCVRNGMKTLANPTIELSIIYALRVE
jgi:hypothetical protein